MKRDKHRGTGGPAGRTLGATWRRLGRSATIFVTLALSLLWCLRYWPGESWWGGIFLVYAPQTIWSAPGLVVVLGAVVARDLTSTLCATGSTVLVLFGFMGLQCNPSASAPEGRVLSLATWNLHNEWRHAAHARGALDMLGADVALTQEAVDLRFLPHFVGFDCVRSQGQRIFVRQAGRPGPSPRPEGNGAGQARGVRIISDGPVHLCEEWRLAHEASLEVDGRHVDVLDVHFVVSGNRGEANRVALRSPEYFQATERYRRLQMQQVAGWIQSRSGPWIVAGDFNTPPGARAWRELPANVHDVFSERGKGFGYTYREDLPLWRIDHILVSPHFRILDVKTVRAPISDHLGLWAKLQLQ